MFRSPRVDDRHHQPALGVDRDAKVFGVVVGDLVPVDYRVQLRVHLQRLDGSDRTAGSSA